MIEGYDMMTDSELITLALLNDEGAKEELLNRCKSVTSYQVSKYKGLFWGRLNHFDVEDLVQECHIAVLESIELYDASKHSGFSNFAKFVIKNRIIDLLRRKNIERRIFFQTDELPSVEAPMVNENIKDIQLNRLLSDKEKQIIALILDGEKQVDIAKRFGVSKGRITQILKKVVK